MKAQTTRLAAVLAGGLLVLAVACDESEVIAPDGSTITINPNPAQVIQDDAGKQIVDVQLVATVRNSIGVPLPGQDVRFTTNSGVLTPPGNTPIETDDLGNAACVLTEANVGPQITATSGKATANITLSAAKGEVSSILLNVSPSELNDCSDTFDLTATALASNGDPVEGFQISFEFATTGSTNFTGNFVPNSGVTDTLGEVTSTLTPNASTCADRCEPSGMSCTARIRARGGLIVSDEFEIVDQIN